MEDLAPVEPQKQNARIWCASLGVLYLVLASLSLVGLRPGRVGAAVPALVLGVIALVAAATRVTYRQRAVAMVVLGLVASLTGLGGTGSTMALAVGGVGWCVARGVAAITIPAALLFRARYRAYAGARVFLALALVATLPFAVHLGLTIRPELDANGVASLIAGLAILASLTGFMSYQTTGAGAYVAAALIAALAAELCLRAVTFGPATTAYFIDVAAFTLTFASASAVAALGLFQILAWRFCADARRIDIHSRPAEIVDEPSDDGSSDWMTGG